MKHHAFTFRNVFCGGLIYAALGAFQVAVAGFAQLSPPPEISKTDNQFSFRASNQSPFIDGSARMNATLNAGGQRIQVPVYARVASNAGTFAARYMFKHPLLVTAAATAFLISEGLQWRNNEWVINQPQQFPISTGLIYTISNTNITGFTQTEACSNYMSFMGANGFRIVTLGSSFICEILFPDRFIGQFIQPLQATNCPSGWFITPAGCVQTPPPVQLPQTEEQFVERVAPRIVPERIPDFIPQTVPLPVERPVINPEPQRFPTPVPYVPPQPRPLIVPLSDPVPIPNTEPQQWRQPLVQINPSPTAANPWRVSLNPKERITTSPHGITEPVSDLDPATPAQPSPQSDFCIRNPEVLACARVPEFDIPNDEIQTLTEVISYEPEQFLGGGSCPSPVTVNLGGHTITAFDTPLYCQFISNYFRPVLLAIAAFTSMMIVAGGFRSV